MKDIPGVNLASTDPRTMRVAKLVSEKWGEQAFQREADRTDGVSRLVRSRPDFGDRIAEIIRSTDEIAQQVTTRGMLTDQEYAQLMQHRMFELFPFLDAANRRSLAGELLALHAASSKPD